MSRFKQLHDVLQSNVIENDNPIFNPLGHIIQNGSRKGEIALPNLRNYSKVLGVDIETNSKGYPTVISISGIKERGKGFQYQNISFEPLDTYDCLEFLLSHCSHESFNFFFNVNFDFDSIRKQYAIWIRNNRSKNQLIHLERKGVMKVEKDGKIPLYLQWIRGKFYKISDKKHKQAVFNDIGNFKFEKWMNLNDFSHALLGYGTEKYYSEKTFTKETSEADSELTRLCAEKILEAISQLGIGIPKHLDSCASISQEYLIRKIDHKYLKPFKFEDTEILQFAYASYHGGIFQNFVKGKVDNVSELDIVSAYPSIIRDLPDLVNGKWYGVTECNPEATFGFYHVLTQFDGYMPYIPNKTKGITLFPKTYYCFKNYLTKPEVDSLRERGFVCYVLKGYEFYSGDIPVYPFRELIDGLGQIKLRAKAEGNKTLAEIAKTTMNSIYGKFAQTTGHKFGKLFNPVYASYITALTRLKIRDISEKYFSKTYEIATDAVIGERNNVLLPENNRGLGSLENKNRLPHDSVVILQTGLTFDLNGNLLRSRGVQKLKESNKISTSFEDNRYVIRTKRPKHMKESAIQDKLGQVNIFSEVLKEIEYNDLKRNWRNKKISKIDLFSSTITSEPRDDTFLIELDNIPNQFDKNGIYYVHPELCRIMQKEKDERLIKIANNNLEFLIK